MLIRTSPGVDMHAEDSTADELEPDEEAEDQAAEAEVQESLEKRCSRQHGLEAHDAQV